VGWYPETSRTCTTSGSGLLIDVLYAHGVDDSIMDEIAAMLDMRTRRDRGRVELDMRSGSYEPHVGDARPASV